MGFFTWIGQKVCGQSNKQAQSETERRAARDAEIERLKKLETDKLHEVQQAALNGDTDATINLREYEKELNDQSVKLLREAEPKPRMG